ncbi:MULTISPECIES: hypothetical protein [unclassified Variovorax]|uniref:hypothetical protein n=1 Tax=unclassified Variovorax TaxID=663243 RepID=UPI000839AA41|nr:MULTISPECIES: hypothetical protein [unclassified Variovorax]PNG50262.1 hypothetical protein CHC06_05885 [Variovorax sp. B2]PNG51135.1 hypothetical protein CHC07_05791 [Variovorax sp. B4]VTU42557.1 hypothetical protein SRS16P1_00299 [Variovorax sp. SRS16]VTU42581.1 hypothetical protein E5P1_00297 [Variovorax sp. PBL-E5]VTU43941.1 hypothetical protein H6P1_00632 [Variovorax sp. PBL-H6]
MFIEHPSQVLNALFRDKPYQGANPKSAKFLFIGLDANYHAEVEDEPIFKKLREYHEDGVAFWRSHQRHHPFLLEQYPYRGDGRFYHSSFARIGFTPEHASQVAFIELLHIPTVGRSRLVRADLDDAHLSKLSDYVLDGDAEHVFVSKKVARLMHATKRFRWLEKRPLGQFGPLDILYRQETKTVYSHTHFSAYGKYEAQKVDEADAIRSLLRESSSKCV